eukprot:gene6891-7586_t
MELACEQQHADNLHQLIRVNSIPHICHTSLQGGLEREWSITLSDGLRQTWFKSFSAEDLENHEIKVKSSSPSECIVCFHLQSDQILEFSLPVLNEEDGSRRIQTMLLKIAEGTSSPGRAFTARSRAFTHRSEICSFQLSFPFSFERYHARLDSHD